MMKYLMTSRRLREYLREAMFKNTRQRAYPRGFMVEKGIRSGWVPSGIRLEFGGGISGNMRLSFQAARSIG
jgi:hypothetical protein